MNKFRINAILTGIFFLISDISSIVGQILYQPILTNPKFISSANVTEAQIIWGAFFEILTALTVAGTGFAIYPVLKKFNEGIGLGYAVLRAVEGAIILIGTISLLTVLSMRNQFLAGNFDSKTVEVIQSALVSFEKWTYLFGPTIILSVNAFLLGYILYKSKLVPRAISTLAMVDGPLIFLVAIGVLFGLFERDSVWGAIVAFPMLLFEVSFSVWLIRKGFNQSTLK